MHVKQKDVRKIPFTDRSKTSLPGNFTVKLDHLPKVFPYIENCPEEMLKVCYDKGPVNFKFQSFDELRIKISNEWKCRPKQWNPISNELANKI